MPVKTAAIRGAVIAVAATGALAAMTVPASADVVCNRFGECWRVHDHIDYPPNLGIVWHSDAWWAHHHGRFRWRADHDGRGYYRNGVWIAF